MTNVTQNPPPPAPALSIAGFLLLKVGGKTFKLDGSIGKNIDVAYHADYATALSLGTFQSAITDMCDAIGIGNEVAVFTTQLDGIISDLQDVPGVGALANQLKVAQLKITDLVLKMVTTPVANSNPAQVSRQTEFQFGFFVDFVGLQFAGVDVDGLGVKLKYGPKTTIVPVQRTVT
ncbi:MAG TPA: hypothetical protein VGJ87_02565, partial [Roseiflexaceae bacterium]